MHVNVVKGFSTELFALSIACLPNLTWPFLMWLIHSTRLLCQKVINNLVDFVKRVI